MLFMQKERNMLEYIDFMAYQDDAIIQCSLCYYRRRGQPHLQPKGDLHQGNRHQENGTHHDDHLLWACAGRLFWWHSIPADNGRFIQIKADCRNMQLFHLYNIAHNNTTNITCKYSDYILNIKSFYWTNKIFKIIMGSLLITSKLPHDVYVYMYSWIRSLRSLRISDYQNIPLSYKIRLNQVRLANKIHP